MRRRIAFCVLIALAVTVSAFSAAGPVTCRLERAKRTDAGEEGLLRLELVPPSGPDEVAWSATIAGHRLTFRILAPGASFLANMEIIMDDQELMTATGAMSFGEAKETFTFGPVDVDLGAVTLPLLFRLERYRHNFVEGTKDVTKPSGDGGYMDFAYLNETADTMQYTPMKTDWILRVGNAEVFTGKFEIKPKRWGTLQLVDADLNHVFGDFAGAASGDLLVWEYESRQLFGYKEVIRKSAPLAARVKIGETRYEVRLERSGPDSILLVLSNPR